MGRGQTALFKERHPKQVLIVPESATTILQIRLLQVDAVAEFGVACLLVAHSHCDVLPLMTFNTLGSELLAEGVRQFAITTNQTRFQHRRLRHHVGIGRGDGFFDRSGRVPNFESNVPKKIQDLLHDLAGRARDVASLLPMEEHYVHVAKWI